MSRPLAIVSGFVAAALVAGLSSCGSSAGSGAASPGAHADVTLDRALRSLVDRPDGPPGVAVVVQRGTTTALHHAGTGIAGRVRPITLDDHLRVASVSKAFSGAAAVAAVAHGDLALGDTIGARLPDLPAAWSAVTLGQLLQHTSGVPDFSRSPAFRDALVASLQTAPPPVELLSYVAEEPLSFSPGTKYEYSNSDNIIAALMIEAATGSTYEQVLAADVFGPLGLTRTSLPSDSAMPAPAARGYALDPPAPPEDVTSQFAAGWTWSSGGIVSTPRDANAFVRGYISGRTTDGPTRAAQFRFRPGRSEPPGPGTNAAGMAVFRYRTPCGTVYGHTGNTAGYTQFIAASASGKRSVSVSVNAQITPSSSPKAFTQLRAVYELAVCAALR